MIKIYSKIKKDLLLHIAYESKDFDKRQDIVSISEFIQVASIKLYNKQTFKPHKHFWKKQSELF